MTPVFRSTTKREIERASTPFNRSGRVTNRGRTSELALDFVEDVVKDREESEQ